MADKNGRSSSHKVTAPELLLKVVLVGTQAHYENRGMIDDTRLDNLQRAGQKILYKSHQESDVRQNLGFSGNVWQGLSDTMDKAIPVLESQSFAWKSPAATRFNSSSEAISAYYQYLVKDIQRLNDLCTIARNLLATTKKAQNLAADRGFDQQVLRLIDVCVRVTARGFDGETNTYEEDRWQKVINLYKRLLITCLQFLHNFIMHNEQRKIVLWLDLFGNSPQNDQELQTAAEAPTLLTGSDNARAYDVRAERIKTTVEKLPRKGSLTADGGLGYNIDDVHALFDLMATDKVPDGTTQDAARLLMDKIRSDMERLSGLTTDELDKDPDALRKVGAALRAQLPEKDFPIRSRQTENMGTQPEAQSDCKASEEPIKQLEASRTAEASTLPDLDEYSIMNNSNAELTEDDLSMPRNAASAAITLQDSKDVLMARLQVTAAMMAHEEPPYDSANGDNPVTEEDVRSFDGVAESADEEEDDEDYRSPGDQERGLLTDVPLVLGPTEIEALPMIIQAGIVDSFGLKGGERTGSKNMQAVRCHMLLSQEAGRNLLRELLIFIAAWDLPDDEFYFKMMVQIMESILRNGLLSHAYQDFRQAKDIVSPAQAVVIKILTHIFRNKYSPSSVSGSNNSSSPTKAPATITKVDVLAVRYIFTMFRDNIIPETCALIYAQGQVRAGHVLAEDFPLNLWDMERVYEGVYQFLEFFAVLTESNDWKTLIVEWEIVYDLVTLLKEIDASIPKGAFQVQPPNNSSADAQQNKSSAISVERPYDPTAPDVPLSPNDQDTAPGSPPLTNEEPSEFEWRNLKKLIILVLSSLVWRSTTVQNQIRKHGGVQCILGCTQYDSHNPFIKEHAIMCLRFLLEGNEENQEIVESLDARGIVDEMRAELERLGVEASIGEDGKVKVTQKRPKAA
ncbi:MAG: hypothetical protein Q9160_002080 [Pyrenula sp. 1 TL-2023]